jgi:citrate synthase
MSAYITAQEACAMLGISPASLYAYVSRGLIHSQAGSDSRRRSYQRSDVETLMRRKQVRKRPEQASESALFWGDPVLTSSITTIEAGELYYRGHNARELAHSASLESLIALLWQTEPPDWQQVSHWASALPLPAALSYLEQLQIYLPLMAHEDLGAYDLRPEAVAQTGLRIVRGLTHTLTGHWHGDPVTSLQRAWRPNLPAAHTILRSTLILCADHELNVSTFSARCVASARGTPYAACLAGLAALQGARHGGSTERVQALFGNCLAQGTRPALRSWLQRGETLPGIGHPLYPQGDPRWLFLSQQLAVELPGHPALTLALEIAEQAHAIYGEWPTLDFALVMVEQALELPPGAAAALFALGRTLGWIAHLQEQYADPRMIRPRARSAA